MNARGLACLGCLALLSAGAWAQPTVVDTWPDGDYCDLDRRPVLWDNGTSVKGKVDGQLSLINGAEYPDDPRGHEESRAADDFMLDKGYVYRIDYIDVALITNSESREAQLEIYDDCEGEPENLLFTFDEPEDWVLIDENIQDTGFNLYRVRFQTPDLWLDGNTVYWVSGQGVEPYFNPAKRTYMCASVDPVSAAVSHARTTIEDLGYGDKWTSTARINLACKELCFRVIGSPCQVLCDNGTWDYDGVPSIADTTLPEARAADNFVLNPCHDYELCYAEGYVATNCDPYNAVLEIYTNECDVDEDDDGRVGDTVGSMVGQAYVTNVFDTGTIVELGGKLLNVYCLQFCESQLLGNSGFPITLPGNQNYWLSIVNRGTGSFNERGFTLFNADCRRECLIKISQARFRSPGAGIPEWIPVEEISLLGPRDLAFRVAGHESDEVAGAITSCWVDVNEDGRVDTLDIGAFLNAYGQGCPQN